jgi:hypothetical protein
MKKLITMILLISLISITLYFYLNRYSKEELVIMLDSSETLDIMLACDFIAQKNDTSYYSYLLQKPYQRRLSYDLRCYGQNGYKHKMEALEKLSGVKFPDEVNYSVDTNVANFYRKYLKK